MINLDVLLGTPALTSGQTYKQVLQRALVFIEPQDQWTQNAFARDDSGHWVKPRDPRAMCWCLMGSIAHCSNELGLIPPQLIKYMTAMKDHFYPSHVDDSGNEVGGFDSLGTMNDYLDHASVLGFLRACIDNIPD